MPTGRISCSSRPRSINRRKFTRIAMASAARGGGQNSRAERRRRRPLARARTSTLAMVVDLIWSFTSEPSHRGALVTATRALYKCALNTDDDQTQRARISAIESEIAARPSFGSPASPRTTRVRVYMYTPSNFPYADCCAPSEFTLHWRRMALLIDEFGMKLLILMGANV